MKKANVIISECEIALSNCVQLEDYSQDRILKVYNAYLEKYIFQNLAILNLIQDILLKEDDQYNYDVLYNRFNPFAKGLNEHLELQWDDNIIHCITQFMLIVVLSKQGKLYKYLYESDEGYNGINNTISSANSIDWYKDKNSSYSISIFVMLITLYRLYNEICENIDNPEKFANILEGLSDLVSKYTK